MIVLKSRVRVTSKYKAGSKDSFWKDMMEGETLTLSIKLKAPGYGRGLYATNVVVTKLSDGTYTSNSITMIEKYMSNLDYIVLD